MLYRRLGNSGLKVSALSLGSWQTFGQSVDQPTTEACMKAAYDAGVNYFDGAEAYGHGAAEEAMGKVLRKMGWRRDTLILSGKASPGAGSGPMPTQKGMSRKHLNECCDMTLQRFGVDYLDLFFCHRPDPATPLAETVFTMNELIRRGKIFYWGTSEFSPEDLLAMHDVAERHGLIGPLMDQTGYNMLGRQRIERDLLPLFEQRGMGSTVYCPLAGGILTGKYNDGVPEGSRGSQGEQWINDAVERGDIEKTRKLTVLAEELGVAMPALALAWILKNPNVSTAITGATRPEHVEQNVKACDILELLTDEIMDRIETILDNKPVTDASQKE
jgi:voltage-dependent potassium channel beta subunit